MRSGPPLKIPGQRECTLRNKIKKDIKISEFHLAAEMTNIDNTVSGSLVCYAYNKQGYNRCVARKFLFCLFVSGTNRKKWLQFEKTPVTKDVAFWEQVLFSNENKFDVIGFDDR